MNWFQSRKVRWLLGVFTALVLLVGIAGFSMSRGYLMHFVYDETTISRDEYYDNAYDTSEKHLPMHCTSGAALGIVYFWEIRCYSTAEALDTYMAPQSGSS